MELRVVLMQAIQLIALGCTMYGIYYLTDRKTKTPEGVAASSAALILGGIVFFSLYG